MQARLLRMEGRVQGVGYRDWMVQEATRLGLHGWVRNRPDGSVEALVSGDEDAVEALLTPVPARAADGAGGRDHRGIRRAAAGAGVPPALERDRCRRKRRRRESHDKTKA
jgi:acylphosphatase